MNRSDFDLSIYLVTDSGLVPEGIPFLDQVQKSIEAGATCVQLREKHIETKDFIERAKKVKQLTDKAGIPLIIDDRLDVALAVGAGLHIGQDDMDAKVARKLLGDDKILGVSVGNAEETKKAIADGADYVGIGICFSTQTKVTKKIPGGPRLAQNILKAIVDSKSNMKTCLIGGINQTNIARVRYQSGIPERKLDGVAIVSCIMAQNDATLATKSLKDGWEQKPSWCQSIQKVHYSPRQMIQRVRSTHPIIHHITNNVVKNFSANVTLAIGGSPIMSECIDEFEDLAKFDGGLVLNAGEITHDNLPLYMSAAKAYNKFNKPIVYDPVGCPASSFRANFTRAILVEGYFTVIKGNQDEILTAAGIHLDASGGCDSVSKVDQLEIIKVAKEFALSTRSVVVVTGKEDIVADGIFDGQVDLVNCDISKQRYQKVKGGDPMMGSITGTGCSLGSVICSFVAANREDPYSATVAACKFYKDAGEVSANLAKNKGPGTFQYLFLDALHQDSVGSDMTSDF